MDIFEVLEDYKTRLSLLLALRVCLQQMELSEDNIQLVECTQEINRLMFIINNIENTLNILRLDCGIE